MKLRRRRRTDTEITVSVFTQLGRSHRFRFRSLTLLPPSFAISLHPAPPARILRRPAPPPPRIGRAIFSSYPSPAVPLLPFFFIKLPKQQSVADVADVVPSQPIQLSYPTIACGAQLAAPLPFPVARLFSTVFAFSCL